MMGHGLREGRLVHLGEDVGLGDVVQAGVQVREPLLLRPDLPGTDGTPGPPAEQVKTRAGGLRL